MRCNECEPRNATAFPCQDMAYDATMAQLARKPHLMHDPVPYRESDYARFKFLLNLPGRTDGSYSRNLNHLWAVGAVVLLWDTRVVEWFYPALRHGETHATVNRTTAPLVLDVLAKRPWKAERLRRPRAGALWRGGGTDEERAHHDRAAGDKGGSSGSGQA